MSRTNVAVLEEVYERWGVGDHEAGSDLFDRHLVAVLPDPSPVPYYGIEAVQTYMRDFLSSWQDVRFEATHFRETGGSVLVMVRRTGTGRRSGLLIQDDVAHVWTFRGSQVVRLEVFENLTQALEAVGLSE
jgi:ketosteroid isomerase-like protein